MFKQAAEELYKIADEIDKEAAEITQFVCGKCNHTATLATINGKRQEAAKTAGENVQIRAITVNDKVACPACDGVMAYKETEASKGLYADDEAEEPKEEEKKEEEAPAEKKEEVPEEKKEDVEAKKKEASQPIDYDSLNRYLNK